jgi:hypothetical protein
MLLITYLTANCIISTEVLHFILYQSITQRLQHNYIIIKDEAVIKYK